MREGDSTQVQKNRQATVLHHTDSKKRSPLWAMTDSNIHVLFESFVFSNLTGVLELNPAPTGFLVPVACVL